MVGLTIEHLVNALKEKYAEFEQVVAFLEAAQRDLLENVQAFKEAKQMEEMEQQVPFAILRGRRGVSFDKYRANLIVDNCDTQGAPVVLASNPSHPNLIGRVEYEAQFGALITSFRNIKAGALHQANGGYLMVEARDVLMKPFAWDALKRSLKNQQVEIEPIGEEFRAIATRSLEPEPIPLDIKVVLIGDPVLYYLLYELDEEFQELFKVKADFAVQTDWEAATAMQYARFIGSICEDEGLHHFAPSGVGRVVERAARMVADQEKVATKFGEIVDLVRESSYWAGQDGHDLVEAADVERAIQEKVYRSNKLEERLQEMIADGTILIDTDGEVIGQVNGISVLPLGDYSFGKPTRITARTHVGSRGVVDIERETELGGRIHSKGVLILAGYLGGKFAEEIPLALSATIAFEQSYAEVEGDSASSAELYALLSSLSEFPLRQNLAVTGSVNQRGQVQAIGAVNEKVEGFFDVCRLEGLTGNQGVLIPAANVKNLMLREDVVEAVEGGQFHVYPVATIDEGVEILTGQAAGQRQPDGTFPEGTVNRAVEDALRELAEKGRKFVKEQEESEE
jgi:predicted ATP-dependent protease